MIAIVCALHSEARPLIDQLALKRVEGVREFPLFIADSHALVVSGVGKIKSAVATTRLISYLQDQHKLVPCECVATNIGIAGAARSTRLLGELALAAQVTDDAAGRSFYSDLLLRSKIPLADVSTFDEPVLRRRLPLAEIRALDLVDMEASAFFEAAQRFLNPSQIYCFKIVSDYLEGAYLDKQRVSQMVAAHIEDIMYYLSSQRELLSHRQKDSNVLTSSDNELLDRIAGRLKLTRTQQHKLHELALSYRVRTGNGVWHLKPYADLTVSTSDDRKRTFGELSRTLSE